MFFKCVSVELQEICKNINFWSEDSDEWERKLLKNIRKDFILKMKVAESKMENKNKMPRTRFFFNLRRFSVDFRRQFFLWIIYNLYLDLCTYLFTHSLPHSFPHSLSATLTSCAVSGQKLARTPRRGLRRRQWSFPLHA